GTDRAARAVARAVRRVAQLPAGRVSDDRRPGAGDAVARRLRVPASRPGGAAYLRPARPGAAGRGPRRRPPPGGVPPRGGAGGPPPAPRRAGAPPGDGPPPPWGRAGVPPAHRRVA